MVQLGSNELIVVAPLGAESFSHGSLIVLSMCLWIVPDGSCKF